MMLTTCSLSIGELRSSNSTALHHSPRQIQKAKHLFAEQGIVVPIVVDENHRIIDGHLRLAVAQELGIETLNAIVVSEASPAQVIELELALNRLAQDSTWDEGRLKQKLEQLLEFKIDLSFTGFEQAEIDKILHFELIDEPLHTHTRFVRENLSNVRLFGTSLHDVTKKDLGSVFDLLIALRRCVSTINSRSSLGRITAAKGRFVDQQTATTMLEDSVGRGKTLFQKVTISACETRICVEI